MDRLGLETRGADCVRSVDDMDRISLEQMAIARNDWYQEPKLVPIPKPCEPNAWDKFKCQASCWWKYSTTDAYIRPSDTMCVCVMKDGFEVPRLWRVCK